jgi:hypothetical protein
MEGFYLALANLSSGAIFLLLAFVFRNNKSAANLIAGYNTSSEVEKSKWNAQEMCRYFSNYSFFWTAIMLIPGIIIFLIGKANTAVWALLIGSWSIFLISVIYTLIYLNRSVRFNA